MGVLDLLSSLALGVLVVLIMSVPLFVKRAVEAYAEKTVGSVFEKQLEKYKAELSRATMAREVMLEREMAFYDTIDEQLAELVPLIQDVRDGLTERPFTEMKRDCLVRIPELVVELQSQCNRWLDFAKKISSENEADVEDKDAARRMCDKILLRVALVRTRQADYLKLISGEKL